jgi:lipopolysaccharide/colanic/teichoic acid biosynthesis glycosyltransferase
VKRLFDVTLVLLLAPFWIPLLAVLWIVVLAKMGSPAIFRQQRPGRDGKPFMMYKFRTMTDTRDGGGKLLSDAERVTPFGNFLRSSSLDELPELINVLKGEMSLVGPRPLLIHYLPRYTPVQARRHEVRPGITGWAQVNGRNAISWDQRLDYDVWYVDNRSFLLDMQILFMTLFKVVRRDDTSAKGHATMPEFQGSGETNGRPEGGP